MRDTYMLSNLGQLAQPTLLPYLLKGHNWMCWISTASEPPTSYLQPTQRIGPP